MGGNRIASNRTRLAGLNASVVVGPMISMLDVK